MRYLIKHTSNLLQYKNRLHAVQPAFKNDGLQTELLQYLQRLLSDAVDRLPTTLLVRLLYEAKRSESLEMTRLLSTLYPTSNHSITLSPHLKHGKIYANKIPWLTSNKKNPKSYNADMQQSHHQYEQWTMTPSPVDCGTCKLSYNCSRIQCSSRMHGGSAQITVLHSGVMQNQTLGRQYRTPLDA